MTTYPLWLKILVAFGAPAFMTAGTTYAASGQNWATTLFAALAAGFGGLAGLIGNDMGKAKAAANASDGE